MTLHEDRDNAGRGIARRGLLRAGAGLAGAAVLSPLAFAQNAQPEAQLGHPPSVISQPPRQWGRFAPPDIYPDPDIIVVDPSFNDLMLGITAIRRVWHRVPMGGRAGLVERGPVSRVQRRAGRRAIPLSCGKPAQITRVPQALLQQQRQFLRLPGPPALDAGLQPQRHPLGA